MAKEPAATTEQTSQVGLSLSRSPRSPGRARPSILIVDDDTDLASRYQRVLEAYGYAVQRASTSELRGRLADGASFDVIVGDVDLDDGNDGLLRSLDGRCPVVLLSHGLAFASALAAVRCGAFRYLLKPVSDESLLEVLVETIRECSAGRGGRS